MALDDREGTSHERRRGGLPAARPHPTTPARMSRGRSAATGLGLDEAAPKRKSHRCQANARISSQHRSLARPARCDRHHQDLIVEAPRLAFGFMVQTRQRDMKSSR